MRLTGQGAAHPLEAVTSMPAPLGQLGTGTTEVGVEVGILRYDGPEAQATGGGSGESQAKGSTMPFKSKAQRRKFAELLVKGEISEETYEEWNRSTGGAELPERVKPKSRRKPKKSAPKKRTGTKPKPKARRRTS